MNLKFLSMSKKSLLFLLTVLILSMGFILPGCSEFGDNTQFDLKYKVYVPNLSGNTITIVPAEKSKETEVIQFTKSPGFIQKVPGKDEIFTLLAGSNQITLLNTIDDTLGENFQFEVGSVTPQVNNRVIFSNDGSKGYFSTSYEPSGIAVMKMSDHTFIIGINLDSTSITDMFMSSDGSRLFAIDPQKKFIYEINTINDTFIQKISVPESFTQSLYNPSTGNFFLAQNNSTIKEFNPSSQTFDRQFDNVVSNIIKMLYYDNKIYVVGNKEIVIVDLSDNVIKNRVTLDFESPSDIKFLPDKSYILVPSTSGKVLMVLKPEDFNTEDTINIGINPGEIVILSK